MDNRENAKILAVAETNNAVDNIVAMLLHLGIHPLRLGTKGNIRSAHYKLTLDAIKQDLRKKNFSDKKIAATLAKHINESIIICTTCTGCGSSDLSKQKFSLVVVDEVSQCILPRAIIPISRCSGQVCLFGDPQQLPPTVVSSEAKENNLDMSLFSFLLEYGDIGAHMLDIQYRMHPSIAQFSNIHFYNGELRNGIEPVSRPRPVGIIWPNPDISIIYMPISGRSRIHGTSQYNLEEIDCVYQVVLLILSGGDVEKSEIGIVTPYNAQVKKIYERFNKQDLRGIEIKSVDAFQGREKEVVIFSAVVTHGTGSFLKDDKRMNVLLTRAKRGLIVIGDQNFLQKDGSKWNQWIIEAQKQQIICNSIDLLRQRN